MRFAAVPVLEIMGGIALGVGALFPFWGSTHPADSRFSQDPPHHARIQLVNPVSASDRDVNDRNVHDTKSEVAQQTARESTIESRLRHKIELLERGKQFLTDAKDYSGMIRKQEVVHGELLDEQTISIKCRQSPFSVYLVWLTGNVGREVLYVEGQNNGQMIAHDGGWKTRIPAFSLATDGALAMRDSRYPVTMAGLLGLIETTARVHQEDLIRSNVASCEIDTHQQFEGRPCSMFTTRYKSAAESRVYRKSITLIDHEWNLPLHSRQFEWSEAGTVLAEDDLDRATLIESYSFSELKFKCHLTDPDFDRTNREYHFH